MILPSGLMEALALLNDAWLMAVGSTVISGTFSLSKRFTRIFPVLARDLSPGLLNLIDEKYSSESPA